MAHPTSASGAETFERGGRLAGKLAFSQRSAERANLFGDTGINLQSFFPGWDAFLVMYAGGLVLVLWLAHHFIHAASGVRQFWESLAGLSLIVMALQNPSASDARRGNRLLLLQAALAIGCSLGGLGVGWWLTGGKWPPRNTALAVALLPIALLAGFSFAPWWRRKQTEPPLANDNKAPSRALSKA